MDPPNYKSSVDTSPITSDSQKCLKGDGSLKIKSTRPRSRTGSGGILRVDVSKPSLNELGQVEPPSPQPSVDRLSVTFATEERSICSSDASVKVNVYVPATPPISVMEKIRFPTITDGEDSDEDYSASVNAIMQRRASTRKSRRKNRRTSSPFSHDLEGLQIRRRSSCITTSSGDTAISMEESLPQEVTQEQIFENIRLHKEVLSSVKMQPWVMRRKLKLVQQAKSYIKKHQGVLQERLAQSRSTRDILARGNIYLVQKLQHYRREIANLSNLLIPWESRIKEIESHFGSVVASYFTFLRWLFWVNLIISVVLVAFVAIPELLTADPKSAGERKVILPEEKAKATNLFTLWDFEGILRYSPLFYGYYTNRDGTEKGYRLPFAYFMTGLGVYIYSFVATLRKMAENSRMSKLSEKDDECVFSWKLFTGWDYMIGNAETAQNRISSIILGFKEALLEEAEKKREPRNWKIITSRILVNLVVLLLLGVSAYAVVEVVQRSTEHEASKSFWRRNETTIVMSLISFLFPMLFEGLGYFEHYHPRKQLRLQLARIMVLNMLNLYSLIFALFDKIDDMTKELQQMKNETIYFDTITTDPYSSDLTTPYNIETQTCYEELVPCSQINNSLNSASFILSNLSLAFLLSNLNQTQTSTAFNIPFKMSHSNNISSNEFVDNTENMENNTYSYNITPQQYFNFTGNIENVPKILKNITQNPQSTTDVITNNSDYYNYNDYFDFDYSTSEPTQMTDITTEYNDNTETTDYYDDDDVYFNFDYSSLESTGNTTDISLEENITTSQMSTITEIYSESTEVTTVYYEYENETAEYYEDNDEYFNFDYSTLDNNENTDLIVQTIISTLLNSSIQEDYNETISIIWNTEDLVSTVSSFLNLSSNLIENSTESLSNVTDLEITNIVTSLYEDISKEALPICKIKKCDPLTEIKTLETNIGKTVVKIPTRSYDYKQRKKLRNLCWETMFGQELLKLTIMDLSFTIISILSVDFMRAIFVRVMNNCWCWDLEKKFPQYGDFKIAENILHLVNNQGMVWMGMFFSPGITVINLVKLAIMMYLRSWAVLTCNVPHEVVFRASRSNNFYLALLLTMLFLCVLPVGFAIVWIEPSWHCGPFSNYSRIYHIFTKSLKNALPKQLHKILDYIASPFIVIPLLVLLILIIYYMISLTNALREANNDLKLQLRRERTEERRKLFQIADKRRRNGSGDSGEMDNTPFGKWKKLLPILPNSKSFDADNSGKENDAQEKNDTNKNKDFLVNFIKKAIKKPTETVAATADDGTDSELHDSLPDDANVRETKNEKEKRILNNFKKILNNKKQQMLNDRQKIKEENIANNKTHIKQKKSDSIHDKNQSISRSSSSKDLRQDSITSNWSDNIPVIKIIGTGSSECILEQQNECSLTQNLDNKNRILRKITHQDHVDIDIKSEDIQISELQIAEPQCPLSSSSETLVTIKIEELESSIDKFATLKDKEERKLLSCKNIEPKKNKSDNSDILNKNTSSIDTDLSVDQQKSNNSDSTLTSSHTRTESSTDYKE